MGTGKTFSSIAVAGRAYLNNKIKKLLVVCPTSIVPVWSKEFGEFADFEFTATPLLGTVKDKIKLLKTTKQKGLEIFVVNYESLWRMVDEVVEWKPDMIISDESQKIKTPSAQQSKALHKLGDIAKYKLALTGTPVQNSPLDFFSIYRFVDKSVFGTSFYAFKNKYTRMGGYGNHQIIGYQNLDELIKKAHNIAYRVTKDEALDLPEFVDTYRYCELEDDAKKVYKQLKKECIAEIESGGVVTANNVLTKLLRLQQLTGGFLSDDDGNTTQISNSKLDELKEIIEEVVVSGGKKLVVFVRFIKEIDIIKSTLEKLKIDYSWIAGEVKDRGEQVRKFQEDPNVKVFIGQVDTAGAGITLTSASTAVFYSMNFNFASYSQARARIHRIGQKNKCTYIHLIVKDTVDEKVINAMMQKKDIAHRVVDEWREYF